jgi:pyruvate ferredoxin oxidoreductase alpha subunit
MVKKVFTANRSVAEAVKLAKPQVVPVYHKPLKPQYLNTWPVRGRW